MLFSCVILMFIASLNSSDGGKTVNTEGKHQPSTDFKCGQSTLGGNIPGEVKGQRTSIGNFPWAAIIFHKDCDSGHWKTACKGTLVSPRAVLTVAHCFTFPHCNTRDLTPQNIMVGLGQLSGEWNSSEPTAQKIAVKEVHIHPKFQGKSDFYDNDIALVLLEDNVVTSTAVMPACLDFLNGHPISISGKPKGYVPFWALLSDCSGCKPGNDNLKYSQATVIDRNTCYNTKKSILLFATYIIAPDKFCSEANMYRGDSGVGLTLDIESLHYLYGIATVQMRMYRKGIENYDMLFSNVSYHQDWIKEKLN